MHDLRAKWKNYWNAEMTCCCCCCCGLTLFGTYHNKSRTTTNYWWTLREDVKDAARRLGFRHGGSVAFCWLTPKAGFPRAAAVGLSAAAAAGERSVGSPGQLLPRHRSLALCRRTRAPIPPPPGLRNLAHAPRVCGRQTLSTINCSVSLLTPRGVSDSRNLTQTLP